MVVAGTNAPRNAAGVPTGGVTGVGNRYAAQGYDVRYVDYPAQLAPLGTIPYDDDVAIGKAATERAVAGYQARCPGRPVVVAGYSQGARIAGDVLSDAGTGKAQRVKVGDRYRTIDADGLSGELYSDPRREDPAGGGGIENVLIGLLPGTTMSGPRPGGFGTVPVNQYCVEGDPICDLPNPLLRPIAALDGFVGYFTKHGYYPARMSAPVHDGRTWECRDGAAPEPGVDDCVVPADPATVQVAREHADPALVSLGLPTTEVLEPVAQLLDQVPLVGGPVGDLLDQLPAVTPSIGILDPTPPAGEQNPALVTLRVDVQLPPAMQDAVVAVVNAASSLSGGPGSGGRGAGDAIPAIAAVAPRLAEAGKSPGAAAK